MTSLRSPGTTEYLIFQLFGLLTPDEIFEATKKTKDYFYKCSQLNLKQKIHLDDAIALDNKLVRKGKEPLFLPHFEAALIEASDPSHPIDSFLSIIKQFGELAPALRGGDVDKKVVRKKYHELMRSFKQFLIDVDNYKD